MSTENTPQNQPLPPNPTPPPTAITVSRPAIVVILYLLNFVVGFSVLVGVVLAYVWRREEATQDWERTHYTYLIRTFWIGLVICVVAMIAWFGTFFGVLAFSETHGDPPSPVFFTVVFGIIGLWLLAAAWFTTRCVMSLVRTGNQLPMPRPKTWMF